MNKATAKQLKRIMNPKPVWSKGDIKRMRQWSRKIAVGLGFASRNTMLDHLEDLGYSPILLYKKTNEELAVFIEDIEKELHD